MFGLFAVIHVCTFYGWEVLFTVLGTASYFAYVFMTVNGIKRMEQSYSTYLQQQQQLNQKSTEAVAVKKNVERIVSFATNQKISFAPVTVLLLLLLVALYFMARMRLSIYHLKEERRRLGLHQKEKGTLGRQDHDDDSNNNNNNSSSSNSDSIFGDKSNDDLRGMRDQWI